MLDELIQDQIMNQIQSGTEVVGAPTQPQEEEKKPEVDKFDGEKESLRDFNLREMRRHLEESNRRARELEEQLKQQRSQALQQNTSPSSNNQMEEMNIGDDELIEGKHLKKYINNIAKQFERKFEEIQSNTAANQADARLKAQYQDFDQVVSQDNLKSLAAIYPEEYNSLMANPDLYGKAKTAYNMIKNFGIAESQYEDIDRRLADNRTKPRSAASAASQTAQTPLSRIGDYDRRILTEADKERYRLQVANSKAFGGR